MENDLSYEVGQNLRRLRQARGLTLSGLAAKAGVVKSLLHALEAGHANPTLATLGEQQLAIDRALVAKPLYLLLDEPTEGIQPSVVATIQAALVRILQELRIGILLVEQKLEFAWNFAQGFYVMDRGRVVLEGRTSEASPETVGRLISL